MPEEPTFDYEGFSSAVVNTAARSGGASLAYAFAVNATVWAIAARNGAMKQSDLLAIFAEWTRRATAVGEIADEATEGLSRELAFLPDGMVAKSAPALDDEILAAAGEIIARRLTESGVDLKAMSTGDLLNLAIMLGIEP